MGALRGAVSMLKAKMHAGVVNSCNMILVRAGIIGGPILVLLSILNCLCMCCARRPEKSQVLHSLSKSQFNV